MGKQKKKKKKNRKKNVEMGHRLSCLSSHDAEILLKRHEKTIFFLCGKYSYLPGYDLKDLVQECRIKIVAGYHLYEKEMSAESTWVVNVVKKTLIGIWKASTAQIRAVHVEDEHGLSPVYDYSFTSFGVNESDEILSLEEIYEKPTDSRPAFATTPIRPDEESDVNSIINHLKKRLPKKLFEFVKNQVFPNDLCQEIFFLERKFRGHLKTEGFDRIKELDEFEVEMQLTNFPKSLTKALTKIRNVLIDEVGFDEKQFSFFSLQDAVKYKRNEEKIHKPA